ncbi:MAG: SEC-C domain-containing protein, partial [Kiritimatiellae bacterium]|nr:SEC-C domain-containing protein [Kiritimatiellia bacterium]
KLGLEEGEVMEHRWLNRSVETAQRRVEQQHYAVRKRTLEYDEVMNKQRSNIYELRSRILNGDQKTVHDTILDVMNDLVRIQCERYLFDPKDGSLIDFMNWLGVTFPVTVTEDEMRPLMGNVVAAGDLVFGRVEAAYNSKCESEDQETLPYMEKRVFLSVIDREWQEYLRAMDDLRHGVSLRAYGQRDPLIEYKKEAFDMFETLMGSIKTKVVNGEFRSMTAVNMRRMMAMAQAQQRAAQTNVSAFEASGQRRASGGAAKPAGANGLTVADMFAQMMAQTKAAQGGGSNIPPMGAKPAPVRRTSVGRNDPCPCGSGKKYKKCCGRNTP